MTQELVSLTIIMAVAAVSPIVAQLIPGRFIPQTVLLLAATLAASAQNDLKSVLSQLDATLSHRDSYCLLYTSPSPRDRG